MQGVNPVRPRFSHMKLEYLLATGDRVMDVMLEAEDIRTLQTIGAVSSNH